MEYHGSKFHPIRVYRGRLSGDLHSAGGNAYYLAGAQEDDHEVLSPEDRTLLMH